MILSIVLQINKTTFLGVGFDISDLKLGAGQDTSVHVIFMLPKPEDSISLNMDCLVASDT